MKYVKSLDGIRGLAILLVVFFHFGYLKAGWIGVQVFFVLSGYLITSILIEDKSRPVDQYLKRFYWRRMLRIFPLYFGFLLVITCIYFASGNPAGFAGDWPYLLTYTVNFARMRAGDTASGYFVHLWSLAVEEQFYLVWPLVVYLYSPREFGRLVISIIVAAPLLRLAMGMGLQTVHDDGEHVARVIYAFPLSHFDAFAAGAAIAVFPLSRMKHATAAFLTMAAIACVLGVVNTMQLRSVGIDEIKSLGYPIYMAENCQFVWGYSVINAVSALGIIGALQGQRLFNLLNTPFLVRIGKISYGMYVIHLPVQILLFNQAREHSIQLGGLRGLAAFAASFALIYLVSEISFRFFESRFLALKDRAFVFRDDSSERSE